MPQDRTPIPAELRGRILVEAGHRCAIPTCRYIKVDIHHIVPWEKCKKHEYENLIALCPNCHARADSGEIDRKALRLYKFNLRSVWDKFTDYEVDTLFELVKLPRNVSVDQSAQLPEFHELFIKRLLDAEYVELKERPDGAPSPFGEGIRSKLLSITEKGRQYVESMGLEVND
jgi:hypothetical protein